MPYIANKPGTAYRSFTDKDTFTGDGSTVAFDMTYAIAEAGQNDLQVFVNDVRQIPGDDYTLGVDDSNEYKRITFTSAPTNGHAIVVLNPGTVQGEFSSVADNAVTTNKLFDGAVTTGKLAADAVDGTKIADDAIDSEHITDGSVDNAHLAGSIANDKLANSSVTINGSTVSLGGSTDIVAGEDWQSVITGAGSSNTAVAGEGYIIDTSSAAHTVNLPASPSAGDFVTIIQYGANTVTIGRNGSNIQGNAGDLAMTPNAAITLVYSSSASIGWVKANNDVPDSFITATGGTETTSGNYRIHNFTSSGCFTVSSLSNDEAYNSVSYLVVAGGGGGGYNVTGGGGGGGFREGKSTSNEDSYSTSPLDSGSGITVTATTYPITVGGGGAGGVPPGGGNGAKGGNSVFATITSTGGGGGGNDNGVGQPGGSGGGVLRNTIGSGNTPPVSPPQGQPGGPGSAAQNHYAGGGGGATQAGQGGSPPGTGGDGGAGATTSILATAYSWSGGGGGSATVTGPGVGGNGGQGGGGGASTQYPSNGRGGGNGYNNGANGVVGNATTGGAGGTNSGGGGGGGAHSGGPGGAGGSGIVVIRYKYQ